MVLWGGPFIFPDVQLVYMDKFELRSSLCSLDCKGYFYNKRYLCDIWHVCWELSMQLFPPGLNGKGQLHSPETNY